MIRRLELEDRAAFRRLRQAALVSHPESYATSGEDWKNAPDEKIDALLRDSVEGDLPMWGYFAPELVGMVGMRRETEPTLRHKATVWGLFVDRDRQRQGIGRKLMESALADAEASPELELLTLMLTTDNAAALHLFERCGFQAYGTEPRARKVDGVYFDQVFLHRFFKENSP